MMKKIGIFLVLGVLLFGIALSGCEKRAAVNDATSSTPTPTLHPESIAFRELEDLNGIQSISILDSSNEMICRLEDPAVVSEFVTAFDLLNSVEIVKIQFSTSSEAVYETEAYTNAKERIEKAYRLKVQRSDASEFVLYVGAYGFVDYIDASGNYYYTTGTIADVIFNLILTYGDILE